MSALPISQTYPHLATTFSAIGCQFKSIPDGLRDQEILDMAQQLAIDSVQRVSIAWAPNRYTRLDADGNCTEGLPAHLQLRTFDLGPKALRTPVGELGDLKKRFKMTLLGLWTVRHADAWGAVGDDARGECLDLRPDGTYFWSPQPDWAKVSGVWDLRFGGGVTKLLGLQGHGGMLREHFVVFGTDPSVGVFWHWQRTCGETLLFPDRVVLATRLTGWPRQRGLM